MLIKPYKGLQVPIYTYNSKGPPSGCIPIPILVTYAQVELSLVYKARNGLILTYNPKAIFGTIVERNNLSFENIRT